MNPSPTVSPEDAATDEQIETVRQAGARARVQCHFLVMSPNNFPIVEEAIKTVEDAAITALEDRKKLTSRVHDLLASFETARKGWIKSLDQMRLQLRDDDIQGLKKSIEETAATITRHSVAEQSSEASAGAANAET